MPPTTAQLTGPEVTFTKPGTTITTVRTITGPGGTQTVTTTVTVQGPGQTLTQTDTIHDTSTVHDTVTDTHTVTEVSPPVTVTETVTAPTLPRLEPLHRPDGSRGTGRDTRRDGTHRPGMSKPWPRVLTTTTSASRL